jgi:hypothetical protein
VINQPTPPSAPTSTGRAASMPIVPLHERDALTLPEAAALGYGSVRVLRQMIATAQLKRCVIRIGVRGIRLLRSELIEELRERN